MSTLRSTWNEIEAMSLALQAMIDRKDGPLL